MNENLLNLTLELIKAKSENPPGNETEVAEIIKNHLQNYLDSRKIETEKGRINLIFGDGKNLVFNGHMDTVPIGNGWTHNPLGEFVNGRIYGRGSSDMKGALAALIVSIENIVDAGEKDNLKNCKFAFVADEEAGSKYGTLSILNEIKGRYGIVMEGSVYDGKIYFRPGVRGTVWLKLISHGKSAHSSNPKSGVNAVMNLAEVLVDLKNLKLEYKKHQYLPDPTISLGTTIQGGEKVNVIPDYAEATIDIRTIPSIEKDMIIANIKDRISNLKKLNPSINIEVHVIEENQSGEIPLNSRIIELAKTAVKDVTGYTPEIIGGMGSNDTSRMILNNTEAIVLGPGDFLNDHAHGKDESVSFTMLENFVKIYERLIKYA
ncbi:MAG: M20 family metallopeptidase [Thermoplasmata archaeon]